MNVDFILAAQGTIVLLAANVVISVLAFGNVKLLETLMFDIGAIRRGGQYYRMVTSGFIHGDPLHLFMNTITLFFIGPYVEYIAGTGGFLLIYFAALLGGSAWSLMENWGNPSYRALGASGAVSGIATAFAMFMPFAMLFVFFIPMPAIVFAVLYIVWSAWASGRVRDGVGHGAHLGGALVGVALVCLIWPEYVRRLWDQLSSGSFF